MYQCQLCQFETNNSSNYQRHLNSKNHLFNINHCFSVDIKNQDNILVESKIMTHKQFLDWCMFLDYKVFENNDYQQIIVSSNHELKFKIISDKVNIIKPIITKDIGTNYNLEDNMNNINNKNLIYENKIYKNILIYSKNIIPTGRILFSYLNYNLNWFCPNSTFIQGFIAVGSLYLIYVVLSSLLWILFWSTLGGFGWQYIIKKLK